MYIYIYIQCYKGYAVVFHGTMGHPWNTLVFHGIPWKTWDTMECALTYHRIRWNILDYHRNRGIPLDTMEYYGILRNICTMV